METGDFITPSQAAIMLGVSRRMIYYLLKDKILIGDKIGPQTWLVSRASVESYAAAHPRKGEK